MFSEWARRTGFWMLDFLRGSNVRRHLRDIEFIMENIDSATVRGKQHDYLSNIISYTKDQVPFYKGIAGTALDSFPTVDKNIIKQHYDSFQSLEFRDQKMIDLHTSGSTGTPFVVRQDPNKRNRVYAEMMYFWGKAGYQIGMKYVFFRVWTDINRKGKISAWARNLVMHDILSLDQDSLETVRQMLKTDDKIEMLLSYASTFDNLAHHLYDLGDTPEMFSIKTILSSSEVLQEATREKLKSVFGCNVVSLYSNQENGTLAQECIDNTEFHLNTASYYFEFLKLDKDAPAALDEPARIVVTDLFNRAMPLIRYDTGDIATLTDQCLCGWKTKAVKHIHGRAMDCIYDTQGRMISPVTITNYMWPFDKLLQFQFIQEGRRHYSLRLNGATEFYTDEEFINLFKGLLGREAIITIEHVNEIPVLSSGKSKHVVCHYKPKGEGES